MAPPNKGLVLCNTKTIKLPKLDTTRWMTEELFMQKGPILKYQYTVQFVYLLRKFLRQKVSFEFQCMNV